MEAHERYKRIHRYDKLNALEHPVIISDDFHAKALGNSFYLAKYERRHEEQMREEG